MSLFPSLSVTLFVFHAVFSVTLFAYPCRLDCARAHTRACALEPSRAPSTPPPTRTLTKVLTEATVHKARCPAHGKSGALRPLLCAPSPTPPHPPTSPLAPAPATIPTLNLSPSLPPSPSPSPRCVGCEPRVGGKRARLLAGAADGHVLRAWPGRIVRTSWSAHNGAISAVCYAGRGTALAASAGIDGFLRL